MEAVVAMLRAAGYDASTLTTRDNLIDVLVRKYPLPDEHCVEPAVDMVLPLPATFSQTPPYGFFALTPITPRHGTWRNVSNMAPYTTGLFFSRKCDGWNSAFHDVFAYLGFINRWVSNG